ncbi:Phage protein [Stenotrophomonas maltophilia]|nr:Phage protein [Stenotrophomonas maltophilia]
MADATRADMRHAGGLEHPAPAAIVLAKGQVLGRIVGRRQDIGGSRPGAAASKAADRLLRSWAWKCRRPCCRATLRAGSLSRASPIGAGRFRNAVPRSHPWPGTEGAGKSRARGPAISMRSQRRPRFGGYAIAHNVYYVHIILGWLARLLPLPLASTLAWGLIVRDRNLTGPWAGFSFKDGRLVTPERRELEPQDLARLSLTPAQAQEWRRPMETRGVPAIGTFSPRTNSVRPGRWLGPTPSRQQRSCLYLGRDLASACEVLP